MVPKLRFKEFCGEWEEKRLGDIVEFLDGKRKPLEKGERISGVYPYYGASGIIDYVKDYIFDEELILLSEDGANIIDRNYRVCFLARGKYWVNNHAHVLKVRENNYNAFICEALERLNYQKYNTGTAQPKLNQDVCKKIILYTPSRPEQIKIADFLSTVDDKIQNQEDKITHLKNIKKGFMQKIFSRKIRFKDDGGEEFPEWEEKKLGDIAKRVMRKNNLNETNLSLTISAQYGLVDQETYFNRKVSSNDLSGYYVLNKGEFAYNKSYSAGYPFGAIKRLNKYEKGAVSTLYICFSLYENVDSNFIEQYFESDKWHREIYMIAVEGARNHGLLNVSIEDFFKIKHLLPCLKEQQKISGFLSSFDEKISTEKEILEHLKELKKGLLQQMFV